MSDFPRTASTEEFEAEAKRLYDLRIARIEAMTDEEKKACDKYMMDGYMDRAREFRKNELFGPGDLEIQINECVTIYRKQSDSPE